MINEQLIASVALDFIKVNLEREQMGSLRFCMLGLDASLVVSIAGAVLEDAELSNQILVKVSPAYDPENLLPSEVISDESITHWRHYQLSGNLRAVLFVSSQEEFQRNFKSVEKVTKIETDTLKMEFEAWTNNSGLTRDNLSEKNLAHVKVALKSSILTHTARTITMFADFVLAISSGIVEKGLNLPNAVDNALPSIWLPRYSGNFAAIAVSKRDKLAEWNKIFARLHGKIRPLLFRENQDGDPIPRDQLIQNYKEISCRLDNNKCETIENFLSDDLRRDDWSDSQQALVELDWREISDLFEGASKSSPTKLNELTLKFFEEEFDDYFSEDERSLLSGNLPKTPTDDIVEFYDSISNLIARNKILSTRWERYVYRSPQPYENFLVGLLATIYDLRRGTLNETLNERKLVVRIPNGESKEFWRGKNARVISYFVVRYRGLESLFTENIKFDFGKLYDFYFLKPDDELKKVTSRSKEARSLKFEVILDPKGLNEKLIFYWEMQIDALAISLPQDLRDVANESHQFALMPTANIARQSVSTKGNIPRLELNDVNTIRDANDRNEGRLVDPNNENTGDLREEFLVTLDNLVNIIGKENAQSIRNAFNEFAKIYTEAIRAWIGIDGEGLASDTLVNQINAYETLLDCLLKQSERDRVRQELWHKIIRFGIAEVTAGSPAAIITPWHPLRLAEIGIKVRQVVELINDFIKADSDEFDQAGLLFKQVQIEQITNYYPEVCVGGLNEFSRILLVATDTAYDYTLAEPPTKQSQTIGDNALDIDPGAAAQVFGNVCEQYLNLLPHERSNFSVVLYNSESKALPGALVSELSNKVERENELQCDLFLTHSDSHRMRQIYEQQNVAISDESGSVIASEAARNFLSRLRVGFLDVSGLTNDGENRQSDLVALHDVISRNSKLVWKRAPDLNHPDLIDYVPARWSRRKPFGKADTAVSVYLTCPIQPKVGQHYLNFVQNFVEGSNAKQGNLIPAREVDFQDSNIKDIFDQTHKIGEWVVNFDELVDRHLLMNNNINVIRHIFDRNANKHTVVSTTTQPKFLRVLLEYELDRFDPNIATDREKLVTELIERANELSGQVVMRAARYGNYTKELLGLVLSMEKISEQLGRQEVPLGWFFLDDLVSWFGQSEEQIADIMVIAPQIIAGQHVLKISIAEAKFVSSNDYRIAARKSAKQLGETVARIARAIDAEQRRIDRKIWLHRIGEFMIEGMEQFDEDNSSGWSLHKWSEQVRADNIPIHLEGFSHVFVYDEPDTVEAIGPMPLRGMPNCHQEIINKHRITELLRKFANQLDHPKPHSESEDSGDRLVLPNTNQMTIRETKQTESAQDLNESGGQLSLEVGEKLFTPQDVETESNSWASRELAHWVDSGRNLGEKDSDAIVWLENTVRTLRRALLSYDMTSELISTRLTPNAALVRFRGTDNLTVNKVEKKRQELLTSHAINVIKVLPAPSEIVIMVARPKRTLLHLRHLWSQRRIPTTTDHSNSSLLLGACESDGELLYFNVGDEFGGFQPHGPHTLIAGETGSGKGVLVQCLLLDICATNSPNSARIQMIDPKAGIDYPWLRNMPHLEGGLITDRESAIEALDKLVVEMERRNRLLAEVGVSKLQQYNAKVKSEDRLPRLWLFHDELADWMLIKEYRSQIELNANRLGVKSRAAGINIVMVTQRPDKDALPMQLRANLTNRLVLKVADKQNSILVLDEPGAERLLGRGHLAAKLSGEGRIIFAQVPYASENDIAELADVVKRAWEIQGYRFKPMNN